MTTELLEFDEGKNAVMALPSPPPIVPKAYPKTKPPNKLVIIKNSARNTFFDLLHSNRKEKHGLCENSKRSDFNHEIEKKLTCNFHIFQCMKVCRIV